MSKKIKIKMANRYIYIYIYGKLLGNKYKVEYIVIYEYVGQIGYGVRYHIIASF